MVQAELFVLALHGDVVVEVRVGHERVCVCGFDLLQQRCEVFTVQVEGFVEHDLIVLRLRLGALEKSVDEIPPVRGVLVDDRHLQRLGQFFCACIASMKSHSE